MGKAREWTIRYYGDEQELRPGTPYAVAENHDTLLKYGDEIDVIEKSAADKLAERIADAMSNAGDKSLMLAILDNALKEYRGEG